MTRSEAIATITRTLETVDDKTLEAAAAHLSSLTGSPLTVGDLLESLPTDSVLPRALTERELALIEQSRDDFRRGRTRTHDESRAYVDAELERRRRLRASA